jgi:hypothetical protein
MLSFRRILINPSAKQAAFVFAMFDWPSYISNKSVVTHFKDRHTLQRWDRSHWSIPKVRSCDNRDLSTLSNIGLIRPLISQTSHPSWDLMRMVHPMNPRGIIKGWSNDCGTHIQSTNQVMFNPMILLTWNIFAPSVFHGLARNQLNNDIFILFMLGDWDFSFSTILWCLISLITVINGIHKNLEVKIPASISWVTLQ